MLHILAGPIPPVRRFDLAPTGALCYIRRVFKHLPAIVLISLPQERCATRRASIDAWSSSF